MFVTADEFAGPPDLPIRSWRIPGAGPDAGTPIPMQDADTDDTGLRHPDADRVHHARRSPSSRATSSRPGTPAGVGVFRDPPVFLEPGDRMRVEIDGIGTVENPVVDASEID